MGKYLPADWQITDAGGGNIAAVHKQSGATFAGTIAQFNTLLANTTLADVTAVSASGSSLPTGITSYKPLGGNGSSTTAGQTISCTMTVPRAFGAVRVLFMNFNTAGQRVFRARCAASPTLKPASGGTGLTPTDITVGGSTTITVPMATTVSGRLVPGAVYSDFIPVGSVARTDVVGADPVFYFRVYSADTIQYNPFNFTSAEYVAAGRTGIGGATAGDSVTTWSSVDFTYIHENSALFPNFAFDFFTGGKTSRVGLFGDSLSAGGIPMGFMKEAVLAGRDNVTMANFAVGGDFREQTSAILRSVLNSGYVPEITIVWNYSVNTSMTTQANRDYQFGLLLSDVEFIRSKGSKPVVVLMHQGPGSAERAAYNVRTKLAFEDTDVLLLDLAEVLGPNGIQAQYTSDGTHLTALAYEVFATYATPKVLSLI
jgi:hypothetical protein